MKTKMLMVSLLGVMSLGLGACGQQAVATAVPVEHGEPVGQAPYTIACSEEIKDIDMQNFGKFSDETLYGKTVSELNEGSVLDGVYFYESEDGLDGYRLSQYGSEILEDNLNIGSFSEYYDFGGVHFGDSADKVCEVLGSPYSVQFFNGFEDCMNDGYIPEPGVDTGVTVMSSFRFRNVLEAPRAELVYKYHDATLDKDFTVTFTVYGADFDVEYAEQFEARYLKGVGSVSVFADK